MTRNLPRHDPGRLTWGKPRAYPMAHGPAPPLGLPGRKTSPGEGSFRRFPRAIDCDPPLPPAGAGVFRAVPPAEACRSSTPNPPARVGGARRAMIALVNLSPPPRPSAPSLPRVGRGGGGLTCRKAIDTEVYFCGFASPDSYGAVRPYLIRRAERQTCSWTRRRAAEPPDASHRGDGRRAPGLFLTPRRRTWPTHGPLGTSASFGCTAALMHEGRTLAGAPATWSSRLRGSEAGRPSPDEPAWPVPVPGHTPPGRARRLLYPRQRSFLHRAIILWWSAETTGASTPRRGVWVCWHFPGRSSSPRLAPRGLGGETLLPFRWVPPRPWPAGTRPPSAEAMRRRKSDRGPLTRASRRAAARVHDCPRD